MPEDINIVLGKNVQLIGFEQLEESEINIVNALISRHLVKIDNKIAYDLLRLKLRQRQKGKTFNHEIKADLIVNSGNVLTSSMQCKNLYNGLDAIMKKLLSLVEHKIMKKKPQHPIRKSAI